MKRNLLIATVCSLLLGGLLWFRAQTVLNPSWEQPAMSSSARITLSGRFNATRLKALRRQIDTALEESKQIVSIWDENTEISRFNRFNSTEPFPVSAEFARVVQFALDFSALTGGAFDPTVKPLVDRWGFGPKRNSEPPEEIMDAVGWHKVRLENGALVKKHPRLQLDLAGLADGYGADCAAAVIRKSGCTNFLVEVGGGEIVAEGVNRSGNPWRAGIESPDPDKAPGEEIVLTMEVAGKALTTAGDYRNFKIRDDGTRYSHIIDPHSGKPAESDVASVTVIAAHGIDADALDTALCVMGSEKGLRWLETHPEFQAFFILHSSNGTFTVKATPGFPGTGSPVAKSQ
ncbi:MAG TPA: FAD:protein FMN transferase [Pontiellaceae bacterium]|nr:FAD:protein FMN transferase [Pontiellaceae bacterium]